MTDWSSTDMVARHLQLVMPTSTTSLARMLIFILWACRSTSVPVPPETQPSGVAQCSPQNRDPCAAFPKLCSAGGGQCVTKEPCEYQCQCPDGRLGRDCSRSANNDPGSVVDTLLIFPKDIFADENHMAKSELFARSSRQNASSTENQANTTSGFSTTPTWNGTAASTHESTTMTTTKTTRLNVASDNHQPSSSAPPSNTSFIGTSRRPDTTAEVRPAAHGVLQPAPKHSEAQAKPRASESMVVSTTSAIPVTTSSGQDTNPSKSTQNQTAASLHGHQTRSARTADKHDISLASPGALSVQSQLIETSKAETSNTSQPAFNVSEPAPSVNQPTPSVNQPAPSVNQSAPSVSQSAPSVSQSALQISVARETGLSQTQGSPVLSAHDQQLAHGNQNSTPTTWPSAATTTTTTTLPSDQDTSTASQQTPSATSTTTSNNVQSTESAMEEFPSLFKATLDNPLPPAETGKNSALSMVVHRVFLPIEQFQPALRSAP